MIGTRVFLPNVTPPQWGTVDYIGTDFYTAVSDDLIWGVSFSGSL